MLVLALCLFSISAIADDSEYEEIDLSIFNNISLNYGQGDMTLYVFVSPTCPYCRKFHVESLEKLVEFGLNVRYLLIGEPNTSAYKKSSEIYCSEKPKRQLAEFKRFLLSDEIVDGSKCEPIVDDMNAIAYMYGLKGTPMLVYPNNKVSFGASDTEAILKQFLDNSY